MFNWLVLFLTLFVSNFGTGDEPVITLRRTGCFGECPIYTVSLFKDGRVRFIGRDFVLFKKEMWGKVPLDTVEALLASTNVKGFGIRPPSKFSIRISDNGMAWLMVKAGDSVLTFIDEYGAPRNLIDFDNRLDRSLHTFRWIGRWQDRQKIESIDPNAKFFGSDSLRSLLSHYDSLFRAHALEDSKYYSFRHGADSEWTRRYWLKYQPVKDSLERAMQSYYLSLSDAQLDSLR